MTDDPAYYQHYRDEVRLSFNYLLTATTIYAAVIGASGFKITEEQFFTTVGVAVAALVVVFVLNLITLAACRAHINSKLRRAITGDLRSVTVDSVLIEEQNRIDRDGLRFARGATFLLYIEIAVLFVRYFTYVPTATGVPPDWIMYAPAASIAFSLLGVTYSIWVYYFVTVPDRIQPAADWAGQRVSGPRVAWREFRSDYGWGDYLWPGGDEATASDGGGEQDNIIDDEQALN